MSRAVAAFITFFSGVAVVVGIAVMTYAVSYVTDRLSCFNSAVLTEEELQERRNASRLTIQSGLAGLLSEERNQIFRAFFEKRSFAYNKPPEDNTKEEEQTKVLSDSEVTGREDEPDPEEQGVATTTVCYDDDEQTDNATRPVSSEPDDVEAQTSSVGAEKLEAKEETTELTSEDDANAPACSICLNDYDNGHKVILGTACSHMFHFDCCMQWVDKGNEHCPYCREILITAKEFYETAVEVVGEERVAKLKKINEEAARRVAELSASGTDRISSPVPPVGRQPQTSTYVADPTPTTATEANDAVAENQS